MIFISVALQHHKMYYNVTGLATSVFLFNSFQNFFSLRIFPVTPTNLFSTIFTPPLLFVLIATSTSTYQLSFHHHLLIHYQIFFSLFPSGFLSLCLLSVSHPFWSVFHPSLLLPYSSTQRPSHWELFISLLVDLNHVTKILDETIRNGKIFEDDVKRKTQTCTWCNCSV